MKICINSNVSKSNSAHDVVNALGLLPHWVRDYDAFGKSNDIVNFMERMYGFGPLYKFNGSVDDDGIYHHVGDEPLDWIAYADIKEGVVFFYPYGIIGLPTADGYFVTRMD